MVILCFCQVWCFVRVVFLIVKGRVAFLIVVEMVSLNTSCPSMTVVWCTWVCGMLSLLGWFVK